LRESPRALLAFGDDDERALDLDIGRSDSIDDGDHERCGDVAGPQADDPDELRTCSHRGPAEREIMRDYHSTFSSPAFDNSNAR
jgi:hypothetical protein